MNKINKSFKLNKKGFSLIELIVVIALMVVATTIASMPLVNMYKARAKSAAEQVNTMLSQSKIDALSGVENEFWLYFDNTENCYKCHLAYTIEGSHKGKIYKTVEFGNKNLTIGYGKTVFGQDGKGIVRIRFNSQTGAIDVIKYNNGQNSKKISDYINGENAIRSNKMDEISEKYIWFGGTSKATSKYYIELNKDTGLIELVYQNA